MKRCKKYDTPESSVRIKNTYPCTSWCMFKKYTDPYGSKFMMPFLNACNIVFSSLPWLLSVKGVGDG